LKGGRNMQAAESGSSSFLINYKDQSHVIYIVIVTLSK
jgi:hypothetical protein